jgi:tetratricopeptide (TPR) repeat protein
MKTNDFSFFIERYNAGEMDKAEKQWFMKELNENEKLRREVELRSRTEAILKDQDLMKLRDKLNKIEKKREKGVHTKKTRPRVSMKYAAAIAGIIILASIALLSNKKLSSNEIIDRYYKPYEASTSVRSDKMVLNQDYSLALEYYNVQDYRNAAIYFHKVLENEPGNMHSVLLNGISNFEIENYPEARISFLTVIDDSNNYYIDHAQWYLALCYIKTGEKFKAIEQLAQIEKSKTIYRKDARKILKSLN